MGPLDLEQCCPIKLSVAMYMFFSSPCSQSHMGDKTGVWGFVLLLTHLNLNSHMWLEAVVLDSIGLVFFLNLKDQELVPLFSTWSQYNHPRSKGGLHLVFPGTRECICLRGGSVKSISEHFKVLRT